MNMRHLVLWLTALLLPLRVPAPIIPNCADCDISDMALVTAGTHVQAGGVALGYLICQVQGGLPAAAGPDPTFAVYRKDGLPTDPSTYVRVGILQSVTDPATVTALLQRSWTLRPDLSPTAQEGSLSGKLDQMFGSLSNGVSGQPLAIKLANVISAARSDAAYRGQLQLLGKTFPGVNLCLGQGWAGSIPAGNRSTFEIRLRDPATGGDLAVVGRVTLDPTAPPVALPAPGFPVDAGVDVSSVALPATAFSTFRTNGVNEAKSIAAFGQQVVQLQSQRVNRAVRIRWSTPDPLRQRSVLQNGYSLWRIPSAAAPAAWIGGASGPTLAALQSAGATRVNALPIATPEDLTAAQAADPANTATVFLTDQVDAGVVLTGGFAEFAYFVTAVDVLGRDGAVSPGTRLAVFNRMPPAAVKGLEVDNVYDWSAGVGKQRLRLRWDPVPTTAETGTVEYEIHRWRTYDGAQRSLGADPVATSATTAFTDDIVGSPNEADANKSFWYTVRGVRTVSAGPYGTRRIRGGHSAPVFGVIRDREGPGLVGGRMRIPCKRPRVEALPPVIRPGDTSEVGRRIPVTLSCRRLKPDLVWAEFSYKDPNDTSGAGPIVLARVAFDGTGIAEHKLAFDAETFGQTGPTLAHIRCRVGADTGAISPVASASTAGLGKDGRVLNVVIPFQADLVVVLVDSRQGCPEGGDPSPVDEGTGLTTSPDGEVQVPAGTREVKFYRRVDDGPMTFIYRAEVPESTAVQSVPWQDLNPMPINGGRICWYAQAYDRDGNAGPYLRIDCEEFPSLALPVPYLDRIVANPPSGSTRTLRLKWTCPPQGVDRFRVFISQDGHLPPSNFGVDELKSNAATGSGELLPDEGTKRFGIYETSRVTGRFAGEANSATENPAPAEFTIDLPTENGSVYTVAVQAVSADSTLGEVGNVRSGEWSETLTAAVTVPWPARPVPPEYKPDWLFLGPSDPASLQTYAASAALEAKVLSPAETGNFDGVGVSIGRLLYPTRTQPDGKGQVTLTNLRINPNRNIYRTSEDGLDPDPLFPCALYRYRIASAADSGVRNDLVQVTPLMESIAYGFVDSGGKPLAGGPNTRIYDPFIRLVYGGSVANQAVMNLFLTDTLPVLRGATYRYVLVRFDPTSKEPRDMIRVSNPVTVP